MYKTIIIAMLGAAVLGFGDRFKKTRGDVEVEDNEQMWAKVNWGDKKEKRDAEGKDDQMEVQEKDEEDLHEEKWYFAGKSKHEMKEKKSKKESQLKDKHSSWGRKKDDKMDQEDKPEDDKPQGDKPQGDKPEGDKPEGDRE